MKELRRISIVWGLLLLAIFVALTFFALKWKSKNEPYFNLEKVMVAKTKSYYEINHQYPSKGNYVIIKYDELKANDMIDELKVNDDNCDGYVKVENTNVIEYNAFIKCGNYTTKNYEKYYEN